eukprot:tig00020553_g10562.t1
MRGRSACLAGALVLLAVASALAGGEQIAEERTSLCNGMDGMAVGESRRLRVPLPAGSAGPPSNSQPPDTLSAADAASSALAIQLQRFLDLPAAGDVEACPPLESLGPGLVKETFTFDYLPRPITIWSRAEDAVNTRFVAGEFARDVYHLADTVARFGDIFVDVGGNIGFFAVTAALRFPHARVVTMEPVSGSFALLCNNVRANGLENVVPLRRAVTRDRRWVRVMYAPSLSGTASEFMSVGKWIAEMGAQVDFAEEVRAGSVTLGDIVHNFLPDGADIAILKIDCEGCEYDILRDEGIMHVLRRVRAVRGEFHRKGLQDGVFPPDLRSRELHLMDCLRGEVGRLERGLEPGARGASGHGTLEIACEEPAD